MALRPIGLTAATNDLSGWLQKGLFEEEANRNLEAAAQAYSTVSAQFDKDRKLAATAIFRLGEIYRKQGKTNESAGQYDRIVREFADQDTLVTLSRRNLAGVGSLVTIKGLQKTLADEQEAGRLAAQLGGIEKLKDNPEEQARAVLAFFPDETLKKMLLNVPQLRQQEAILRANPNANRDTQFAILGGKLGRYLTAFGADGPVPEAHYTTNLVADTQLELRNQLTMIKERVDFNVGVQKARLQVLQAAAGPMPDRESGAIEKSARPTGDEEKEIRRIQAMIQNSPDLINAASGDPRSTPLITAATKGQTLVANFLLDHGAEVNLRANASTPLGAAVANGHKAMTELLLSRGANVNGECYLDQTALHVAADKGFRAVAEVLLANKAQLEARTAKGYTPLHLAAKRGAASLVQFLVSSGANVNAEDNDGVTVLSSAIASGKPELVRPLLTAKADPNAGKANLPLLVAIRELRDGDTATLEELLRAGADANKEGLVLWDITYGGNLYQRGRTVTPLCLAVDDNKPEAVKLLLKNKADPNGKNLSGMPVLFDALANTNVLQALLQAGASPDANDGKGGYALLQALSYGNSGAVEMLLAHGANPNIRSVEGRALLDYAAERGDKESVELLLNAKAEVNAVSTGGLLTALHRAAYNGSGEIVEILLAHGANPNLKDNTGNTPLHWTMGIGGKGIGAQKMAELLLSKGADPNIRNNDGLTPLDLAKGKSPPQPGVPVALGIATVTFRQPDRSVASAKPDPASVAALLRQHGALDDLPNLDRIEVRRPSANFSAIAFQMSTNDWNEFGLLELIALHYGLISTERNAVWGVNNWEMSGFWRSAACQFPDLSHVVIRRPASTGPPRREVAVNVAALLDSGDCTRDAKLMPGDIVEISEADHPVNEPWAGLGGSQLSNLLHCVSRTVTISIKGNPTTIRLSPQFKPTNIYGSYGKLMQELTRGSFMLKSVLAQSRLLRASSDLSNVKVTRRAQAGGQNQEWLLDCSGGNNLDLWLRDGDVIEVPDKP